MENGDGSEVLNRVKDTITRTVREWKLIGDWINPSQEFDALSEDIETSIEGKELDEQVALEFEGDFLEEINEAIAAAENDSAR